IAFPRFAKIFLGQELPLFKRRLAGVDDDVILEINDLFQAGGLHVEQGPEAAGHGLEEPDVNDRGRQLDVAHALAADTTVRHLDAAAVANHPLILHAPVFAAGALPVLFRAENALAEESVFLGTIGPIIDRLRFLDFAEGPAANVMGAGQADAHRPIIVDSVVAAFTGAHKCPPIRERSEATGPWRDSQKPLAPNPYLDSFLFQLHVETQAADLVGKHVETGGRAGFQGVFTLDHRFIDFGAALDVIGLHGEELLEDVSGAIGLQSPHFHFAETLTAEARL